MNILEEIKNFPKTKNIKHCNKIFQANSLHTYVSCPVCNCQIKIRSMSSNIETEDIIEETETWLKS